MTTEFQVRLANRPGMLATLAEQVSSAGINIEALTAYGVDEDGVVHLVTDDHVTTRSVLTRAGLSFEERTVLVTILDHRPGSMAAMARRLADSGVNIEAVYLLRSSAEGLEFALAVDDPELAKTKITLAR